MTFVKTPLGVIMHVENHSRAVEIARTLKSHGALLMLEPATPLPEMEDGAAFFGIDRSVDPVSLQWVKPEPITVETLQAAAQRMLSQKPKTPMELHAPSCPKIATRGLLACRCGTAAIEAAIEDERLGR